MSLCRFKKRIAKFCMDTSNNEILHNYVKLAHIIGSILKRHKIGIFQQWSKYYHFNLPHQPRRLTPYLVDQPFLSTFTFLLYMTTTQSIILNSDVSIRLCWQVTALEYRNKQSTLWVGPYMSTVQFMMLINIIGLP